MICPTDTFVSLTHSIPIFDERLHMTAMVKKVAWIFYTEFLPVRSVEFKKLNYGAIFEISLKSKPRHVAVVSLNESPSQTQGELCTIDW